MVINLTADIKNLATRENSTLLNFLTKIQLKGKLEGIIIKMLEDEEGLVDLDGNKIRVTLPRDMKKGDKVVIMTEKKEVEVILKPGEKGKEKLTIKASVKVEKEEGFRLEMTEKVDVENESKDYVMKSGISFKSKVRNIILNKFYIFSGLKVYNK